MALDVSGVFVTGNRGLRSGDRYLIQVTGRRLAVRGPVHVDPNRVAVESDLAGLDATGLNGRLIISGADGRGRELTLVFIGVSGGSLDAIAQAMCEAIDQAARSVP